MRQGFEVVRAQRQRKDATRDQKGERGAISVIGHDVDARGQIVRRTWCLLVTTALELDREMRTFCARDFPVIDACNTALT